MSVKDMSIFENDQFDLIACEVRRQDARDELEELVNFPPLDDKSVTKYFIETLEDKTIRARKYDIGMDISKTYWLKKVKEVSGLCEFLGSFPKFMTLVKVPDVKTPVFFNVADTYLVVDKKASPTTSDEIVKKIKEKNGKVYILNDKKRLSIKDIVISVKNKQIIFVA